MYADESKVRDLSQLKMQVESQPNIAVALCQNSQQLGLILILSQNTFQLLQLFSIFRSQIYLLFLSYYEVLYFLNEVLSSLNEVVGLAVCSLIAIWYSVLGRQLRVIQQHFLKEVRFKLLDICEIESSDGQLHMHRPFVSPFGEQEHKVHTVLDAQGWEIGLVFYFDVLFGLELEVDAIGKVVEVVCYFLLQLPASHHFRCVYLEFIQFGVFGIVGERQGYLFNVLLHTFYNRIINNQKNVMNIIQLQEYYFFEINPQLGPQQQTIWHRIV